jgi:hypothetical protein
VKNYKTYKQVFGFKIKISCRWQLVFVISCYNYMNGEPSCGIFIRKVFSKQSPSITRLCVHNSEHNTFKHYDD